MRRVWILPVALGLAYLIFYVLSFSFNLHATAHDYEIQGNQIEISVSFSDDLAHASLEGGECQIVGERTARCVVQFEMGTLYRGEIQVEDAQGREASFSFQYDDRK